jgi:hypothetical protein
MITSYHGKGGEAERTEYNIRQMEQWANAVGRAILAFGNIE